MKKIMNLMKMFIRIIKLIYFSKKLNDYDNFIRYVLLLNIINLLHDIIYPNWWLLINSIIFIYFNFYLYFTYIKNNE
jgi:hypothetical protein